MKMRAALIVFLLAVCYDVQCRKLAVPVDKHVNSAFINMEGGGAVRQPAKAPAAATPAPAAKPPSPAVAATPKPAVPAPNVAKPVPVTVKPAQPSPAKASPVKPVPVNPAPVNSPTSTPGPGSVKQLVNFYDSQGKASVIRPYSYAEAVKKPKS